MHTCSYLLPARINSRQDLDSQEGGSKLEAGQHEPVRGPAGREAAQEAAGHRQQQRGAPPARVRQPAPQVRRYHYTCDNITFSRLPVMSRGLHQL